MQKLTQKVLHIVFVGPPNVGKSTLVNQLVGKKVSIVTPKAQTTRNVLKGIKVVDDTQLIFIDTPGIFDAKSSRDKLLLKTAWQGLSEADEICLMIDARHAFIDKTLDVITQLKSRKLACNLIINKIDKANKAELLNIARLLSDLCPFKNIFMISALKRDGLNDLVKYFISQAYLGAWLFSPEDITNAPLSFMAAEIVREKIFFNIHSEIPYNINVETEQWEDKPHIAMIHINILVNTESHKKIIIGQGGGMLKNIGTQARLEIERMLGKKACLKLHVKILL